MVHHRMMLLLLLASALALLASPSPTCAEVVEYSFHVRNQTVNRLCQEHVITTVNGSLPGPIVRVREGDVLVVHVFNESPYNLTIHWHGIFQMLSGWADGPQFVTQCPIRPGSSYAYKFRITGQEGTLWWHAHSNTLRATVYGALVIRPTQGRAYPFPKPHREYPIILGEWWNANVIEVENQALANGGAPNNSDAYTINGLPGDLYPCSQDRMHRIKVVRGKTYLLRIINAALNNQLFFKIAHHKFKVVAIDASYTEPYLTDVVLVAPGQTTDVLLEADQDPSSYYMAARPYASAVGVPFDNTTTRGLVVYQGADPYESPVMPALPAFNDTPTAHEFNSNITGLVSGPFWVPVPYHVDEHMFITVGLGLVACGQDAKCAGPLGQRFAASMSNVSFQLPTKISILEAFFGDVKGIYTPDFPDRPLFNFDFTNSSLSVSPSVLFTKKSTSVKMLKYNSTVEIVLQNTAVFSVENHPIHIHGMNFHVLAQGFGNYDPEVDREKFNLKNPQIRNTIGVPAGGWAVIRFKANNPGVWIMHCHLDVHLHWGLATAFVVENGPTRLPPPPLDYPIC